MASVRIGRVGRPHGLHGHLLVDECPLTPAELAALGNVTWRSSKGEERPVTILEAKPMMAKILVHFKGFDARVASSELVLGELMVEQERLPDPGPGVAYAFQLIGMTVETTASLIRPPPVSQRRRPAALGRCARRAMTRR